MKPSQPCIIYENILNNEKWRTHKNIYHNESECSMWNNSDDQNMDQQNIIDQFNDDLISYDEAREVAIRIKQKNKLQIFSR